MTAMHRVRQGYLVTGLLVSIMLGPQRSEAQFTDNYQTNIISGVTNNWVGGYFIGFDTFADVLLIQNSGVLSDYSGYIGYGTSSNWVLVTGSGSIWSNTGDLYVGSSGTGNNLVISDGGQVTDFSCLVGYGSDSNTVAVTGSGSVWVNAGDLSIGYNGGNNSLVISNGGQVVNVSGSVGNEASSNCVLVTGSGSVWSNAGDLYVGWSDRGNSLVISNAGQVVNHNGYVGEGADDDVVNNSVWVSGNGSVWWNQGDLIVGGGSSSNLLEIAGGAVLANNLFISEPNDDDGDGNGGLGQSNQVRVNSGSLIVTNAAGTASLVVGDGGGQSELLLNGGTVTADTLLATSGTNSMIAFNGGLLEAGVGTITNGAVLWYALGTNSRPAEISGDLALGGVLNITDAGGFTATTYTLFTYGGALTYNGLAIATTPTTNFAYAIDTSTAGQVNLIVTRIVVPQPAIFGFAQISGTQLSINWSNGNANSVLLSSTNVARAMADWTPIVTNPALPYTITIDPTKKQNFFRVMQH